MFWLAIKVLTLIFSVTNVIGEQIIRLEINILFCVPEDGIKSAGDVRHAWLCEFDAVA